MKKSSFSEKWGSTTSRLGFAPFPTALIFAQDELKLSPTEMNVLLNLLVHWWSAEQYPYPSQRAIAFRMGVSTRTVQRTLAELESKSLIIRNKTSMNNKKYKGRSVYNLEPLVKTLDTLSPRLIDRLSNEEKLNRKQNLIQVFDSASFF
jgi:predicted transcriptional regulator